MNTVLSVEPIIRLGAFASVLALMAAWELMAPRRQQNVSRLWRWPTNLGVVVIDILVVRLLFPRAAVGGLVAEARGWGVLNILPLPSWLEVILAVVLLDLAIYGQHVMFHAMPCRAGALAPAPHAPC